MASKPPGDDLGALLDRLDGNKAAVPKVNPEDEWVAKFDKKRKEVIRPVFEQLGAEIEKRGHDFLIAEREFRRGNRAIPDEAYIRIDIYLSDEKAKTRINADRRPGLGFITSHKKQMVQVMLSDITSRGGVESKVGEVPLEKLDAEFIREKFIALFRRLVVK